MTTNAFPHRYDVGLKWESGHSGVISAPPRPDIAGGPPPQFGGEDGRWSPEHLLLSSLGLCYMTTFLALNDKAKIEIKTMDLRVEGTLEKLATGLAFSSLNLRVRLSVPPADKDRAEKLLLTAKKYCIVSNALKTPVELSPEVNAA
jgi:organic hydroperoxide reductase OsmC/OhrA